MNSTNTKELFNFFSISDELILTELPLPYDLYINSSTVESRVHFVKILKRNETLKQQEIKILKDKYYQFYLHEYDRSNFLNSLKSSNNQDDLKKIEFIKENTIRYLDQLFNRKNELNTNALKKIINECEQNIKVMIEFIKGKDISEVQKIISSVSFHDFYTFDHSINVSMYCISLFNTIKPNALEHEIILAGMAGLLHDIGKILVPTHILNKPDKLNTDEMAFIKKHPKFGYDLLVNIKCNCENINIDLIRRVILEHHENFNGTGYPHQLEGSSIHMLSRLTSICDFFDAITTKRAYHEVLNVEVALALMSKSKGKKIDPNLFEAFAKKIDYLEFQEKLDLVFPEDFDPCQPTKTLPLENLKPHYKIENFDKDEYEKNKKIKKRAI